MPVPSASLKQWLFCNRAANEISQTKEYTLKHGKHKKDISPQDITHSSIIYWRNSIGFGVGFVIGKIIKPALHADISAADVFLTILLAAIFFILSFIIHIVIHEAGHMLAAMARGWKFLSFMIMGVVLSRRDGRFRLSRFSMAGAAGQCLMLPPENGDTPFGIAYIMLAACWPTFCSR